MPPDKFDGEVTIKKMVITVKRLFGSEFIKAYLLWVYKGKTLKSQLLKKLWIEFYKILDLSSPNIRQKYLFYAFGCNFFFLQPIAEGNCDRYDESSLK